MSERNKEASYKRYRSGFHCGAAFLPTSGAFGNDTPEFARGWADGRAARTAAFAAERELLGLGPERTVSICNHPEHTAESVEINPAIREKVVDILTERGFYPKADG